MTQIGGYSPETARMILDVVKYLKASGFVIDASRGNAQTLQPTEYIYVRNDSGEEIPPFACMQTTGTVESGGQNYITVDKPADVSGEAGWYLFNGQSPIPEDEYGIAFDGPVVRMLTDGSSAITSGELWSPDVGEWAVTEGDLFIAIGADDIETDVMRAWNMRAATNIYKYTLTSSSVGSIYNLVAGSPAATPFATGKTLYDPLSMFGDQTTGDSGYCFRVGGYYYRLQAPCKT